MEQPPPFSSDAQNPPEGNVPPSNIDYAQQVALYPPQQPGYTQLNEYDGAYPPQDPEYPPRDPGYPPQDPEYPSKNPGYPPQGQGYVQQPAGFSSQTINTTTVVVQNQPQVVTGVIPVINDHMGLSVVSCVCCILSCCWPIGLCAIIKSSQARNLYVAGDYVGAVASANTAKNLAWAAIVCGLIIHVISIIVSLAG